MASRPVKLKLLPRSTMKSKSMTRLPARILGGDGILVERDAGTWTVSVDADNLPAVVGLVIGTDVQAQDADLQALADNTTNGLLARTGSGTVASRTLTAPAAGITLTNGDGVSGNPTLVLANDLAALEGLSSTGIAARTATDTWAQRTITGTTAEITVTFGDGVSGNPTISIPAAITLTGKTATGGTFNSPTFVTPVLGTPSSGTLTSCTGLPLSGLAAQAAYTLVGNNSGSSAIPTAVDIAALTSKASPAITDYLLLSDQAASGAWKKVTVSSVSGAGAVSSIAGNTGAFTLSQGITNSTNDLRADWSFFRNYLDGLILSYGTTTSFTVGVGVAADSGNIAALKLSSSLTKTTSAWAVGGGNGGIDTGAVAASTWYHVWLIRRSDTGVVDALFSLSASAPTMPTNYDQKRRIGSLKTNGSSQFTPWVQNGDEFRWDVAVTDINTTNPGTSAITSTLSTPTGVVTRALLHAAVFSTTAGGDLFISPLSITDTAPTSSNGSSSIRYMAAAGAASNNVEVPTNTSAQVRTRNSTSDVNVNNIISTIGWVDPRGRNA